MRNSNYWKKHYVIETDAEEIERKIRRTHFVSGGRKFELIYFEQGKNAPSILISRGSGGHAYIFAELAYFMHFCGYNVFVMPKHGGFTISQLEDRHADALAHISQSFNDRIGVFGEGLGVYASFYLALAGSSPMKSIACLNGPAILTEDKFHKTIFEGTKDSAKRRRQLLPFVRILAKIFPWAKMRISAYLDFKELIDTEEENRKIEEPFVRAFDNDPDFDMFYPLSAIMSLVSTPAPKPLSELKVPAMFIVPVRGFFPSYFHDLFNRLPRTDRNKLIEVDGGVFWILSHPKLASKIICYWFDKTL